MVWSECYCFSLSVDQRRTPLPTDLARTQPPLFVLNLDLSFTILSGCGEQRCDTTGASTTESYSGITNVLLTGRCSTCIRRRRKCRVRVQRWRFLAVSISMVVSAKIHYDRVEKALNAV